MRGFLRQPVGCRLLRVGLAMRQVAFSTSLCLSILAVGVQAPASFAQEQVEPVYSVWDVELGQPALQLPDSEVAEIACGTAGPLISFPPINLYSIFRRSVPLANASKDTAGSHPETRQ